jgi:hypothetical protein
MDAIYQHWVSAMRRGDFAAAWDISARSLADDPPQVDHSLPYHLRAVWRGQILVGRDVLVRCFHGLGDTIQFARYLPLLRERAASVTVEMQRHLMPLFTGFPGIDRLIPFDEAAPTPDSGCDIEIMELQFALRRLPGDFPPPYLSSAPAPLPAGTVGLCWEAGGWDQARAVAARAFAPLALDQAVTLVARPTDLPMLNPAGCPRDMRATAALVAGVDLVITVDTMIAHLAGAMGRPTWLLVKQDCDWRWSHEGERSLWYPSIRIYRQHAPGAWDALIARVAADLERWRAQLSGHKPEAPAPTPQIPVSWGELIDKITILEIKAERIGDEGARANVREELGQLMQSAGDVMGEPQLGGAIAELRAINRLLWDVEDRIRRKEAAASFDAEFVRLARSVYQTNDWRAAVKRRINDCLGSALIEEKNYGAP